MIEPARSFFLADVARLLRMYGITMKRASPSWFYPTLLLLFAGSGCAALIYEIVWFQLLQLVIGSSAVSLGVLLGSFMGGMCLGSIALAKVVPAPWHPLRVYASLELGIGLLGLLALLIMPVVSRLYAPIAGHGLPGILLRGVVAAVCLLPPTMLMGATLPAIARWVETTPHGVSWLGLFYGGNIAGAVFGCLLVGFYLLRVYDMATATFVAASVNGGVAVIALWMAKRTASSPRLSPPSDGGEGELLSAVQGFNPRTRSASSRGAAKPRAAYVAIALSGLCALGAEVVWTRLLSLLLGPTVYTFSIILAVFLIGLGLGSTAGSLLGRRIARPGLALGWCQILLTGAIAWTSWMLSKSLPYWPINPSLSQSPWFLFQLDLARCLWALLPATILWGASFPLALAAIVSRSEDAGRTVGKVYAANTIGAIVGAVGCSLVVVPWLGTQHTQQALVGISALAAVLMFAWGTGSASRAGSPGDGRQDACPTRAMDKVEAPDRGSPSRSVSDANKASVCEETASRFGRAAARRAAVRDFKVPDKVVWQQAHGIRCFCLVAGCGLVAAILIWSLPGVPWVAVAYGRYVSAKGDPGKLLYVGEGINASVAVTELGTGVRNFHVSGKVEASTEGLDMRLQRMLGHFPALVHRDPRSVLIVGCGAGVTAGSFVVHSNMERIVICEIEPLIPRVVSQYFAKENHNVMSDPRTKVVYDDARHYIFTTREKFDIITSDPIHPWVKGVAPLYTREYYQLVKEHLNPGGVVAQWVPLYESSEAAVKSEIATFLAVFPEGTVWSNDEEGEGYDVMLLGQVEPMKIDADALDRRLQRESAVAESLREVGFRSVVALLGSYAGGGRDLLPWLGDAEINQDRSLRLQYLAGLGLNLNEGGKIYDHILRDRKFPEKLFVTSELQDKMLKVRIHPAKGGK